MNKCIQEVMKAMRACTKETGGSLQDFKMGHCTQILNDVKQCLYLSDMNFVTKAMMFCWILISATAEAAERI